MTQAAPRTIPAARKHNGKKAVSGGRGGWRKIELDLAKAGAMLRQYCGDAVIGMVDPVVAHASFDRANRPRSVHATFAEGWRVTMRIGVDGSYSVSYAIKLVSQSKSEAVAAQ